MVDGQVWASRILIPLITLSLLTGCGLFSSEKPDEDKPDGTAPPPPSVSCAPIELALSMDTSEGDANPCHWVGQTASATTEQVNTCMVAAGELRGTQDNPGVGAIEVRRSGTQIHFAATANGSGPWTLELGALDCNTPGTCGPLFDHAEYEVIIDNAANRNCSDFGELTLTIPLHQ